MMWGVLSHSESAEQIVFSWGSSVTWACRQYCLRTILGCFQGVSGVVVWVKGEASPFPLCGPGVWAFGTPLCICSPDTSLRFDSPPNGGLQQQRPFSQFVISGNRWTSPKPWGCSWILIFLSGSWEVRGWFFSAEKEQTSDPSSLSASWERPDTLCCAVHGLYIH